MGCYDGLIHGHMIKWKIEMGLLLQKLKIIIILVLMEMLMELKILKRKGIKND